MEVGVGITTVVGVVSSLLVTVGVGVGVGVTQIGFTILTSAEKEQCM